MITVDCEDTVKALWSYSEIFGDVDRRKTRRQSPGRPGLSG